MLHTLTYFSCTISDLHCETTELYHAKSMTVLRKMTIQTIVWIRTSNRGLCRPWLHYACAQAGLYMQSCQMPLDILFACSCSYSIKQMTALGYVSILIVNGYTFIERKSFISVLPFFSMGSTPEGKNLLLRCKFFPSRVDPISGEFQSQEKQTGRHKSCFPL